jgi:hypothetical protein
MNRVISKEQVGKLMVSTVSLREQNDPDLELFCTFVDSLMGRIKPFETIVFIVKEDGSWELNYVFQVQYSSEQEAIEGHEKAKVWAENNQEANPLDIFEQFNWDEQDDSIFQ